MITPFPNMEFAGLHLVHWLISALLPLLLAVYTIIHLIIRKVFAHRILKDIKSLSLQIEDLQGRSINHMTAVDNLFRSCANPYLRTAFSRMIQDARDLYQGRWLPDPDDVLNPDKLLRPALIRSLSLIPAAVILAVGIAGSLAALLVRYWFPMPDGLSVFLILLPGLTGLSCAILTAVHGQLTSRSLRTCLANLKRNLERRLPVFDDQAGLALLIDNFSDYDRRMNESLRQFTATASRLAENDLADGIRRSIEQVLLESVAPSIRQASNTLGNLASELTGRQERGMQDLAVRFASALSAEIAGNLQPVNREIAQMGTLMADVRNYIEYAMRALETVRQQSEGLLSNTRDAMSQMSEARAQLTEDLSQVDQRLGQMAKSTVELATLYQGNEENLSQNVRQLSQQFNLYGQHLGTLISSAVSSIQDARLTAAGQESAESCLAAMQAQVNQLTGQLGTDIGQLLQAIREESAVIAGQTGEIGQQLGALNTSLEHSLGDFTRGSAQYVQKTLSSLDNSLAELAGRIAGTAAELRDAVDTLPQALRHASRND